MAGQSGLECPLDSRPCRPARPTPGHNVGVTKPEVPLLPEDEGFWYLRWREMWEESLDDEARSRIKRAVWKGLALADPVEARYAVTLAHRDRGFVRWWPVFAVIYVGIALTWLVVAVSSRPLEAWAWLDWLFGTL
jgi:hypothetical protein